MTRPRHPRTARPGFTLVELLVATALVVLILTILAVAFGAASDSLSRLRATGNMATQLRTTQDRLRADLEAQHFDPGDSPGPLRLADLKYHLLTPGGTQVQPPTAGYFRIEHGTGSKYEGQDLEGMLSTRADGTCAHALEFTAKLQGRTPDDQFVVPFTTPNATLAVLSSSDTPLAANLFASKWARVRWQLSNPITVSGGGVPVTVWTLYRDVRAIAPANVSLTPPNDLDQFAHLNGTTQTLRDLSNPANRSGAQPGARLDPFAAGSASFGDDIVLTNVTSFEVKPAWESGLNVRGPRIGTAPSLNATIGTAIPDGSVGATVGNSDFPFDDLPAVTENTTLAGQRLFDTWAPLSGTGPPPGSWNNGQTNPSVYALPLRIRVTALQVKIRVFDPKTLLSRQVSFVVQP